MGGSYFDQIAQELRKQKQLMDRLEAENRELREQLAALRAGQRILVVISGTHFTLQTETPAFSAV